MPNIKGKKFAYTPAGMRAAKAYAKKTGEKIQYMVGGSIPAGSKGAGLRALKKKSPSTVKAMGYKKYGGSTKPKMGKGGMRKKR